MGSAIMTPRESRVWVKNALRQFGKDVKRGVLTQVEVMNGMAVREGEAWIEHYPDGTRTYRFTIAGLGMRKKGRQ
jgi:hypothetical protein